ncbi:helix-turn-helix domain-containing protein [Flagellimonas flava]|uniref:Helix-turn-helix domain-containing protein n=1 Tax=Flagellimonas flava TaxID=570519 RepID=A0A1M5Q6S2_9FLAO|nr:helix-turn-helix domain-containing protein [Allomuricauda flava]SHH09223.1 Helix-turn-helix domain-containing protein [Allomuricauda flava]
MDYTHLMVMASSLLLGLSIFFALYLFMDKRNRRYRIIRHLLAFILLAFALRIAKSVIYILFPEYASTLTSFGIVGMLAIGPLYWYYINAILVRLEINYWHLTPMLLVLMILPWLAHNGPFNIKHRILLFIYVFSLVHMLIYFVNGFWGIWKNRKSGHSGQYRKVQWVSKLTVSMLFIWIGFVMQAILKDRSFYILVTFGEALVFFGIAWVAMRNYGFIVKSTNRLLLGNLALKNIARNAITVLKKDKLYTKNDLSISILANKIGTNRHTLSIALNNFENKSFPELLNHFRIEYALQLLKDVNTNNLSIEAIAFESGFNSLSVFYSNFKKYNKLTPAEYRKKYSVIG